MIVRKRESDKEKGNTLKRKRVTLERDRKKESERKPEVKRRNFR